MNTHEELILEKQYDSIDTNPENDGVTHINIDYNGKTELGVLLSHFAKTPFEHPYFGTFNSMEGFWHFLKSTERSDKMRKYWGNDAKVFGKQFTWHNVNKFYEVIMAANFYKIEQTPNLKEMFNNSELPFANYYVRKSEGDAAGQGSIVIKPTNYVKIIKMFEDLRIMMHYDERPLPIDYSDV